MRRIIGAPPVRIQRRAMTIIMQSSILIMARMRILMMRILMRILMSRRSLMSKGKHLRLWAFILESMRYGISVDGILQRANERKRA